MSLFYPSDISTSIRKDRKFTAELKLYDQLKINLGKSDAHVYYSCSFVKDNLEPGECDFIIVFPNYGIAFIEVKGGGIKYDDTNDKWYSINRENNEFEIKNPFLQALKAERYFHGAFEKNKTFNDQKISTQYFVCFPDIEEIDFNLSSEVPKQIILTASDFKKNIVNSITSVLEAKKNNIQNLLAIIGPPYMKNIHQLLKPSFTINPSFLTTIEEEQNEMQLSDSQIAILKTLRYQKKVFIEGCAGTGKTLMAVQRAKEFLANDQKVLILTHSRTLPVDIRKKYFNNEKFRELRVESAFQFTSNLARRKNINNKEPFDKYSDQDVYDVGFPELLLNVLDNHCDQNDKYDAVIVDEGQRFNDEWWIAIDNLKKNNGYLYVFYDPNQTLKNKKTSDFLTEEENNVYPLDENFRNTKKIFNFSKNLYQGFEIESKGPEGREPEIILVNSIMEQNKEIANKINYYLKEGVDQSDIAVINFGPIIEKGGLQRALKNINLNIVLDGLESRLSEKHIKYDSVARFQGLEYPIVILTNFNIDLAENEKNNLYIALTRSMNELIIITEESKFNKINNLIN